jgi:hypothetical protein
MRAGRMVIGNYSTKAIDLLLPELENGMFDPGWRIRVSMLSLTQWHKFLTLSLAIVGDSRR